MDALQKLLFVRANARGETVTLRDELSRALAHRPLPLAVRRLAGEVTVAALLTAAALETDGSVLLQIAGDGPVKLVVVEVRRDLSFRVCVEMKPGVGEGEVDANAGMTELVNASGNGRCALILDPESRPADRQPYQGIVPLEGKTFAEALETYFRTSEQVETRILLAADDASAGGVMLQKMPATGGTLPENYDPEAWERLSMFASTVKSEELLTVDPTTINTRLFWEEEPRVTREATPVFRCSCSNERVENSIRGLGEADALALVKEKGAIEVTCNFCGEVRRYDEVDVRALFANANQNAKA